jgi:hypothetical protein
MRSRMSNHDRNLELDDFGVTCKCDVSDTLFRPSFIDFHISGDDVVAQENGMHVVE